LSNTLNMSKKRRRQPDLTEQLRRAIRASGLSAFRIATDANVDRAIMSRFVSGGRGITLNTAGRIARYLGLELRQVRKPKRKG
jgi:plasmid maintenance system antidote protein VapI